MVYQQGARRGQISSLVSQNSEQTIAAVATAPGCGGIGVIRVSGSLASDIAQSVLGKTPFPRYATLSDFLGDSGEILDHGIAIFFPGPASFTGEDVLELQGHGGPVVLDLLLERILKLGARFARPGEFSERAFLNGKMDLVQVEAIADLIHSGTRSAARAAIRSLTGEFSERIHNLVEDITKLRIHVEAAIDFPEEEIDFLADKLINQSLKKIRNDIEAISSMAEQGRLVRDGINVVLAGKPNTGKSSLLNYLARANRAIVSDIAGTTRDVLIMEINLDGLPVHIIDTAGLRQTNDSIEKEGVRRAGQEIAQADLVLHIVEDKDQDTAQAHLEEFTDLLDKQVFTIVNKIDINGIAPGQHDNKFHISAKTGAGVTDLVDAIHHQVGFRLNEGGAAVTARRRHLDALARASKHLTLGEEALNEYQAGEILAEELRLAQMALSEITGDFTSDDLLGRIFSDCCIGK